jgi:Protein of unknown function (DUF3105)
MPSPRTFTFCALAALASGCGQPFALPDGGAWSRSGLGNAHLVSCDDTACGDGTAAPVGGPHCGTWLSCRKYTEEQKRCSWIHNLEHGHAVLLYNCPGGCPDDVAALERHFDAQLPRRILVAPDARIPKRIAALVWGHGWLGDAYDLAGVRGVLDLQDADAPEPGLPCPN